MNNPEGIGQDPEFVAPQTGQTAPVVPERQQSFWRRLFRNRPVENPAIDQQIRAMDENRQQGAQINEEANRVERATNPENMIEVNTPQEAMELCANMTAAQWRARELNAQYGQGAGVEANQANLLNVRNWFNKGWCKAFMAGEFDFQVDQNGQIQKDNWNRAAEIGRRTLRTLLNKHTAISATIGLGIALTSGGIGIPAAAAMIGGTVGRGIGEAWEAFEGRKVRTPGQKLSLREVVARRQFEDHARLQSMAEACQAPEISDEERNNRLMNLNNAYCAVNEEAVTRQRELLEEDADWNKRRDVCAKIGSMAGLGVGIWAGAAELSKQIMTMDIDGNGVSHLVEKTQNGWQFAYNSVTEFFKANAQSGTLTANLDSAGRLTHDLGAEPWKIALGAAKNLLPHLAQMAGVVGGLFAGRAWEKAEERGKEEKFETELADQQHEAGLHRNFLNEQVPNLSASAENQVTPEDKWAERFGGPERVPANNQIWVVSSPMNAPILFRINTVDLNRGLVNFTPLNRSLQPILNPNTDQPVAAVEGYDLNNLVQFGRLQSEALNDWSAQFGQGDQVRLDGNTEVRDNNGRLVPAEQFIVVKNENDPTKVKLRRNGQEDIEVSILQMLGINRFQPEVQVQPERPVQAERPRATQVFEIQNRALLPDNFQNDFTGTHFAINSVTDNEIVVGVCDENGAPVAPVRAINISNAEWQELNNINGLLRLTRVKAQEPKPAAASKGGKQKN